MYETKRIVRDLNVVFIKYTKSVIIFFLPTKSKNKVKIITSSGVQWLNYIYIYINYGPIIRFYKKNLVFKNYYSSIDRINVK